VVRHKVKFEIAGICVSVQTDIESIQQRIKMHYKAFLSDKSPDINIDVMYKSRIERPAFETVRFKTQAWELGFENDIMFIYFNSATNPSLVKFANKYNHIIFLTADISGQMLLYLFPEILFSMFLPDYNALMVHACGILKDGKGYLFIAQSGGGKSTIAALAIDNRLEVLNDDRIILCIEGDSFKMYGNPWHGDIAQTSSKFSGIKEVFFLKKAATNRIAHCVKREAVLAFMRGCFYVPVTNKIMKKRFDICGKFAEKLTCNYLYFKPDKSIWTFLENRV
jgi:hypothetical protein